MFTQSLILVLALAAAVFGGPVKTGEKILGFKKLENPSKLLNSGCILSN